MGATFNVGAFLAVWGMAVATAAYVWTNRNEPRLALAYRLLGMAAIAGVLAAPTAVWIARTIAGGEPAAAFDYRAYLEEFFPYHNLVGANWTGALATAAFAVVVWDYVRDTRLYHSAAHRDIVAAAYVAVLAILLFGAVQPYVINSQLLSCLFPLRMDSYFLVPLFVVFSGHGTDRHAPHGRRQGVLGGGLDAAELCRR